MWYKNGKEVVGKSENSGENDFIILGHPLFVLLLNRYLGSWGIWSQEEKNKKNFLFYFLFFIENLNYEIVEDERFEFCKLVMLFVAC